VKVAVVIPSLYRLLFGFWLNFPRAICVKVAVVIPSLYRLLFGFWQM